MKKHLSIEDMRIWRAYTQHVEPLHASWQEMMDDVWASEVDDAEPLRTSAPSSGRSMALSSASGRIRPSPEPSNAAPATHVPQVAVGVHARIHAASARQLKRGQKSIEHVLDLHGCKRSEAFEILCRCITRTRQKGGRVLLVITGKGKEQRGVLRSCLPLWVREEPLESHILAIQPARAEHGGGGAFYLLLRK